MERADFAFAPGLQAAIVGPRSIVEAFRREYAPLEVSVAGERALVVGFSPRASAAGVSFGGRHKTVGWQVRVTLAERASVGVAIELQGAPRTFARSLVQGYVVEPLLSIVAAERNHVLLPGAGVLEATGLTLILGRSGAGKSTLMARLAATGHQVLGDDQLLLDADGDVRAFPRRLRFYPDIEQTAPEAWLRLPANTRLRLRLRRLMSTVSRGFVRPSLAVDRTAIGSAWLPGPAAIGRVVLLERRESGGGLAVVPGTATDAVTWAMRLIEEQRSRLALGHDPAWRARLADVEARERRILSDAFERRTIERLSAPSDRPAARSLEAVARHLGFDI